MATDLQLRTANVKQQSLWAVLGLTIITLGIYGIFWYYRVNREMRDIGGAYGDDSLAATSPGLAVLALFVPIVNLFTLHNTGRRVQKAQAITGHAADYSMAVHWILILFTGLWPLYTQHVLNAVWTTTDAAAAPASPASPISSN